MGDPIILPDRWACRRRTAAGWVSNDEILYKGEIGLVTDNGRFKFGDGTTAFASLLYSNFGFFDATGLADGDSIRYDATAGCWYPIGSGAISPALQFDADLGSTADSDPGNGLLKWNNATQASATTVFLDDLTSDGVSLTPLWADLKTGGFLYLQHATDADTWQIWDITGVTDAAGYVKLAVALLVDGGSFADADPMMVTIQQGRSDKQPLNANLTAIAGLTTAANKLAYFTGAGSAALTDLFSLGRSLIGQATTTGMQSVMGITGGGATGAANEAYEKTDFVREGFSTSTATGAAFVTNQGPAPVAYISATGGVAPVFIPSELYHAGIIRLSTGTASGSYTRLCFSCGPTVLLAGGEMGFDVVLRMNSLSDATNRFQVSVGLCTAISGANERMFANLRDDINSYNWYLEAVDAGGTTTTNSSVSRAAGSWVRVRFLVNATATSIEGFVAGVSLGTVAANISTQPLALFVQLNKVLGTSARTVDVDVGEYRQVLAVAR